jgi:hypothetical protein
MLKKTHVFVLGVATAGLLGFAAPMASAATVDGPGGLVNVSNNQVPVQVCGNDVFLNGIGAQVPAEGDSALVPLLSPQSFSKSSSHDNRGCVMLNNQQNKGGGDGLVNVTNNQIPVQVCGNDVYGNVIGAQVPLEALALLVPALSPQSVSINKATDNRGCAAANNQENGKHDGYGDGHGDGRDGHGGCPCKGGNSVNGTSMTTDQSAVPATSSASTPGLGGLPVKGSTVTSGLNGLPVKGGTVTSGLSGLPAVGALTSGLQAK